jgi:hypothetical protein
MKTATILSLGALGALFALPAEALTISNMDADSHTITVTVNGNSKELTVEPQAEVDTPCDKGCTVGLDSGEQYELKGDESASIEDGTLFVDSAPSEEADDRTETEAGDKPEASADNASNGKSSKAQ